MSKLTVNESVGDFNYVVKLSYQDLQAAGNGGQIVLAKKPAFAGVELVGVAETVAFAGTTTLVIDVGTTGADPDEYIDALDVDAMTAPVFNTGDAFTTGYTQAVDATNAAEDIVLEVTDANIASATAGEIVVGIRVVDLGRFA
ncbi:MAG: hypothetical protein KAJ19_22575 [Gammaproteobacteria bacterium]|jgi:hypothetical protein|nr:hypothetical protein [Gammaproteobacteria bacterium]